MKVEYFSKREDIPDNGSGDVFIHDIYGGIHEFDPHIAPDKMDVEIKRYKIRTIAEQRAISKLITREGFEFEERKLKGRGFSRFGEEPTMSIWKKEKRFVIDDDFINSYIDTVETKYEEIPDLAMKLLLIDLSRDINKLTHDLYKADRVVDIHREKLSKYDDNVWKISWFDRVFRYKKALRKALS